MVSNGLIGAWKLSLPMERWQEILTIDLRSRIKFPMPGVIRIKISIHSQKDLMVITINFGIWKNMNPKFGFCSRCHLAAILTADKFELRLYA